MQQGQHGPAQRQGWGGAGMGESQQTQQGWEDSMGGAQVGQLGWGGGKGGPEQAQQGWGGGGASGSEGEGGASRAATPFAAVPSSNESTRSSMEEQHAGGSVWAGAGWEGALASL